MVLGAPRKLDENFRSIAKISALCSGAYIECKSGMFKCVGEPTEGALKVLAEKIGLDNMRGVESKRTSNPDIHAQIVCDTIESAHDVKATLEFDRDRKSMSVIVSEKMSESEMARRPKTNFSSRVLQRFCSIAVPTCSYRMAPPSASQQPCAKAF